MTITSTITLANSIIGVSILAMPFCFKQCGVILATIMLILSGMLVKVACHLLLKSALLARRRTMENLAFHTHGHTGKLLVELGIIGYLAGTAIAFFVVMGDLGPPMVSKLAGIEATANLRMVVLTGLGLFVALPLSLLRDLESLQYICTTSILFYVFVVARVVVQAAPHITSGEWMSEVNLWRPAGMLQCFPIFSLALSCQTNIFAVYTALPDATPAKMNDVVKGAVNLCSGIYITIGFFGYVAFCYVEFAGNILTAFPQSLLIDVIRLGFCVSVAVSFPLVLFPCRTSIHSLIFRQTYQGIGSTELVNDYIPPTRFNMITGAVILICLTIGILVPDIELVLGLVGSTMGSCVCTILPALMFLKLTTKDTTERLAARGVLAIGVCTLLLGTYVNLESAAATSGATGPDFVHPAPAQPVGSDNLVKPAEPADNKIEVKIGEDMAKVVKNISRPGVRAGDEKKEDGGAEVKRVEPVVPVEPKDLPVVETKITSNENVPIKSADGKVDASDTKGEFKPEDPLDRDKKGLGENGIKSPDAEDEKKKEDLLKALEDQKEESAKILKEQKEVLQEMKEHVKQDKQAEEIAALVDSVKQRIELQQAQQQPLIQQAPVQPIEQPQQQQPLNQQVPLQQQPVQQQPIQQQPIQQQPVQQQPLQQQQLQQQPVQSQQNIQQQPIQQQALQQQPLQQQPLQQQPLQQQPLQPQQPSLNQPQEQQKVYQPGQPVDRDHLVNAIDQMVQQQQPVQQMAPRQVVQQQAQQRGIANPQQQQQPQVQQQQQMPAGQQQAPLRQQQQQQQAIPQQQQAPLQQQQVPVQQQQVPILQQQAPIQQQQAPIQQHQQAPIQQRQPLPQHQQQLPVQQQQHQAQFQQQQWAHVQQPIQQQAMPGQQQQPQTYPRQRPVLHQQKEEMDQVLQKQGGNGQQQQQKGPKEPPLQKPKLEGGASGRDLKESRHRREVIGEEKTEDLSMKGEEQAEIDDTACLNDPLCAEKFSRNPVSDSLVDRDFAKIMKVGSRNLLSESETETNLTKKVQSL